MSFVMTRLPYPHIVEVEAIERFISVADLNSGSADHVGRDRAAEDVTRSSSLTAFDEFALNP